MEPRDPGDGDAGRHLCGEVAPHWTSLQGAHGGIVAALSVRAAFFRLDDAPRAPHLAKVETHLDASALPFSGAARGEWRAWCRPKHGPTFDSAWLTMFGDDFPPAVFARSKAPSRAVTVEYATWISPTRHG